MSLMPARTLMLSASGLPIDITLTRHQLRL